MVSGIWLIIGTAVIVLNLLVIWGILRGRAYREYPFLFLYCVIDFLSNVVESAAYFGNWTLAGERYTLFYWSNEAGTQVLIFALMLTLIYQAAEHKQRMWITFGIGAVVVILSVSSVAANYSAAVKLTRRMTALSWQLSFYSALLNVVLWTALIRSRNRSVQMLLIAGGLGLLTAGKAIGHQLRGMSPGIVPFANAFIILSHMLCLLIWWRAFTRRAEDVPAVQRSSASAGGGR